MGGKCRHGGGEGGAIFTNKSKRKAYGCMAAFYNLFDFQHLYFSSHHHKLTIDSPSRSKGLKLVEESPPSATSKAKQSLNIPVSMMRVKTERGRMSSRLKAIATDTSTSSSEICNSPGSKTPSLVARLMGLDLLPEKMDLNLHTMAHYGTSGVTSHPKKGTRLGGTRSLPESPRVSSARKSDFDTHRLSLQLNKREEFGCSRLRQRDQEEIQSPRQILKQIKERVVTRRVVGVDRRDTTVSCSPRTRFSNKENKPTTSSSFRPQESTQKPKKVVLVSVSKASGEKQRKKRVKQKELRNIKQCKKPKSETRFTRLSQPRDTRNKAFLSEPKTDALHRKKFKNIPKSSDVDKNNISVTKTPQKQVHLVSENGLQEMRNSHGSELCSIVVNYSSKHCSNIGEIASVEFDRLLETKKLEEEGEEMVAEVERDILEALVQETMSELNLHGRRTQTN